MKKLKIAVIGCRFNHPLGERVLSMWRVLAKKYPVKIHILTTDRWIDKKGDSKLKNSKNLKVHKLITIGARYGQFKHIMPSLPIWLKSINPDVIYAQEEPIQMGVTWPAYLTARFFKKPFVFFTWENLHTNWFFPIGAVEKSILSGCDNLAIAGTQDAKEILLRKGVKEDKISVLPETGIDINKFRPKRNKKHNKTIIYVGRLVKEKGINLLLKARNILLKQGKRYHYLFIGQGPLRQRLDKLSEKSKDIIVLDPVPYKDIPKIYHRGDILFYASLRTKKWVEQYGYSMLEALASGLPVIASKVSGPKEIVIEGETGALIDVGDYEQLAEWIKWIFDTPDVLKRMSKDARADAVKRLSNEAVAEKTYKLLRNVYDKKMHV